MTNDCAVDRHPLLGRIAQCPTMPDRGAPPRPAMERPIHPGTRCASVRRHATTPARPVRRAHRPDRRRGEARPGRDRDGDPRPGDAPAAPRGRPAARPRRRARPVPARRRRAGDRPRARRRSSLYDRDGNPHADLGGDRVHFVPGSSGLKVLDHRTGETRLANSTDFVEYVRLGDGLDHIAYLATAFSTNDDIEAQVSRRVAPLHDPDELEEAGRVGRLHRARRAADGRDDAALPGGSGRPHRPPDVDLHDHRDRQLPLQRGLLPEPDRLRRGRASRSRSCRSR